jgi:hypothetical protein
VISIDTAISVVKNTRLVQLEASLISLYWDWGWALGKGSLKVSDRVGGNMNVRCGVNCICVLSIVNASSISCSVGVVCLRHWVVSFVVCKPTLKESTVAT